MFSTNGIAFDCCCPNRRSCSRVCDHVATFRLRAHIAMFCAVPIAGEFRWLGVEPVWNQLYMHIFILILGRGVYTPRIHRCDCDTVNLGCNDCSETEPCKCVAAHNIWSIMKEHSDSGQMQLISLALCCVNVYALVERFALVGLFRTIDYALDIITS